MKLPFKAGDQPGQYEVSRPITDAEILAMARRLIERRFARGRSLTSPDAARDLLLHTLAPLDHELFCALFLDNRHRVLAFEQLFRGTLDGASVHPREVVKCALALNAGAVIFAHNHPSGHPEPSQADRRITEQLREALKLVEVRVLDHFIVGGTEIVSFAERGLL